MTTTAVSSADETGFPKPAYAWYVVSITFLGYTFAFIDRIIVGILTPAIQQEFGINDSQAGLLQGLAFALFYTLFGLPLGWLTDRWNRKWLLTIGMTVWSLMTALCGVAKSFTFLFLARLGVGMGEGSLNPCATSLIGDYFPPRTRSRAFGVYVMGTALGTGFTYLMSGLLLGWLARRGGLDFPVLGHLKPWQAVFVLVGLPGLIPALLFAFTVREPVRREVATKTSRASSADILAFMRSNRMTLFCHHAGISLVLMTVYGFVNWMPTFFLRVHSWQPQQFATIYGGYGMVAGIFSALSSGWLATWFKDRGVRDGTMLACALGCAGCVVGGVLAPLMPSPQLALTVYILTGIFANYPSVLGLSAIAEIVPNEMRGIITAIYIMLIGLLASGIGPFAVGVVTDVVFGDKAAIGSSMIVVSIVTGVPGVLLLLYGRKAYRDSLSRATWLAPAA
jgi:MFS family permease